MNSPQCANFNYRFVTICFCVFFFKICVICVLFLFFFWFVIFFVTFETPSYFFTFFQTCIFFRCWNVTFQAFVANIYCFLSKHILLNSHILPSFFQLFLQFLRISVKPWKKNLMKFYIANCSQNFLRFLCFCLSFIIFKICMNIKSQQQNFIGARV